MNAEGLASSVSLLYADTPVVGLAELEKIVQCVALYADRILLHGSFSVSRRASGPESELITRQLLKLAEAGLLRLWDFEGQRASGAYPSIAKLLESCDVTMIDADTYDSIHLGVKRRVLDYSESIRTAVRSKKTRDLMRQTKTIEGLAELVHLRNNLWTSLIADHLGVDGLVLYGDRLNHLRREFQYFYSGTEFAELIDISFAEVSRWRGFSGFAFLNIDDLVAIRKKFPEFREFIISGINPIALHLGDKKAVLSDLEEIKLELLRQLEEELKRRIPSTWRLARTQLETAAISVASVFVPPLSALGNISELARWSGARNQKRHLLYLMELESLLKTTKEKRTG